MGRIISVVNEFSLLDFGIFCIILLVRREHAEAHWNRRDDLLYLVDVLDDAFWDEFIEVRKAICFLKQEKSTIIMEQVIEKAFGP